MKKIRFILLILCIILTGSNSFSQNYFNLRYGHDSLQDIGTTILTTASGYYVINFRFVDWNNSKVNLTYLDSIGNIVWQKLYGQPGIWYTGGRTGKQLILSTDKKKMYFACSAIDSNSRNFGVLWSFNSQGDSLFCKYYGDSLTFYSNNHCQITSDTCIIIAGAMDNGTTQAMLIKTDSLGNKLWEQSYGGSGTEYGCSVLQTPDGGYMMGMTTTSFGGDVDMAALKTDSNGNQQWLQPYSGNYNEASPSYIISLSDGNYALCGGLGSSTMNYGWPRVIKINPAGSVIWDKKYSNLSWSGSFFGIIEVPSTNNIIGYGTKDAMGYILKINQNGDSLWQRSLHHPTVNYFGSTSILWSLDTSDTNGYVAAGVIYPASPDTGSVDVWVIKVDEWGCDTLGCQFVSVEENQLGNDNIKIYPNPTSDYIFVEIETELFESGSLTFSIYDIIGKKHLSIQAGSQWESFDVSKLASGTYLLQIEKGDEIIDKIKFIRE